MPFVDIPQGTMHYEVDGPAGAPWAVILPGAATAKWVYEPLRDRLQDEFRVVTLSYRGIGESRNDKWQFTPVTLAEGAWSGLSWWSMHRPQWTLHVLWRTDGLTVEAVEPLPGHPAPRDAGRLLGKRLDDGFVHPGS